MANVFVSYSRHSEGVARILVEDIGALRHTVWYDQDLSGGQAWWDRILGMIRDCDVFVFVLDPPSLDSTACQSEYSYAADLGKPILPVLVTGGVAVNLLPPALAQIQFVDYRQQDRGAALELATALSSIASAPPLPDPLPAPPEAPISYLGSLKQQIETKSTLSYENQTALVIEIKKSLRDPCTTDDARAILERFRERPDLFAIIADEIDDLLKSIIGSSLDESAREIVEYASGSSDSPRRPIRQKITRTILLLRTSHTWKIAAVTAAILCIIGLAYAVCSRSFHGVPDFQHWSLVPGQRKR